jgi:hypothetical protein
MSGYYQAVFRTNLGQEELLRYSSLAGTATMEVEQFAGKFVFVLAKAAQVPILTRL